MFSYEIGKIFKNTYFEEESAKLRALRVKNVLTCHCALRAYVVAMYFAYLRAHVLTCLESYLTHLSTWLTSLRVNMS